MTYLKHIFRLEVIKTEKKRKRKILICMYHENYIILTTITPVMFEDSIE